MVGKLQAGVSGPGNKDLQIGKTFFSKWTVKVEAWTACGTMPVNTTEEIRRIVREELHRRNRPASINCFERTQTLIRGAATAVNRNINCQTVCS